MPAMATATKFTFDLDFNAPDDAHQPEPEVDEPEVEEEEQAPTFSEEELERARAEGFEAGKEDGRKEAATATEQRLLETVEAACRNLAEIYNAQAEANQDIAKEMIQISTVIAKKMFPDLNTRNALGEVERVVQDTLKAITDEPRAQIMVHPDLREPLTERLAAMTQRAGFEGKVFVNPDNTVPHGDCRVEWSHGAAVRDSEAMLEQIDEIIKRNLHGEEAVIVHDEQETSKSTEDEQPLDAQRTDEPSKQEEITEPDTIESTDDDTQSTTADMAESVDADANAEIEDEAPLDDIPRADDHFAPSVTAEDTEEQQPAAEEVVENQGVVDDLGEPPVPHIDVEQDKTSADQGSPESDEDQAPQMINSDPVSPDMSAAILDAQGAMSEEEDK